MTYKDPIDYLQKEILTQLPKKDSKILLVPNYFLTNLSNDRKNIPKIKTHSIKLSELFEKQDIKLHENLAEEKVKLCENKQRTYKDFILFLFLFTSVIIAWVWFGINYIVIMKAILLAGFASSIVIPFVNEQLFTTISNYKYWIVILREAQDIMDARQD